MYHNNDIADFRPFIIDPDQTFESNSISEKPPHGYFVNLFTESNSIAVVCSQIIGPIKKYVLP